MRHRGLIGANQFIHSVFIPRPEEIGSPEFCLAIGEWLNTNGIVYRGNIAEFAYTRTKVLLRDAADQRMLLEFFEGASSDGAGVQWLSPHFTKTSLRKRGWTDRLIRDCLPAPSAHRYDPTRYYRTRLGWAEADVVAVEDSNDEVRRRVVFKKLAADVAGNAAIPAGCATRTT